ncbi:hypothetical protein EXIGLDRAFT_746950 [Exidia glandulosa HHB12029]|uniref:Uncharacterized protein n=1 Tax=Exidia glandulosa HHB12029 TaxID=1314781 RepID=A0A165LFZ3_EXIGL|nr:hypothetical protein EXIGLDRAFT_746950 [Exidia glandulosa HHB12029]
MKFTSVTATLLGCAALVSAAPIRVVVVSKSVDGAVPKFRVGHAAAHLYNSDNLAKKDAGVDEPVFHILPFAPDVAPTPPFVRPGRIHSNANGEHKPCGGKSVRISNWFRSAVGLPPIAAHNGHAVKFHAAPAEPIVHVEHPHRYHHRRPHNMGGHLPHAPRPFTHRLQVALLTLGPWEGRIVAFVLGCGIGVLLRLVWVMCVIAFRSVRRSNEEDVEFDLEEEEEYLLPPPEYTDEKVVLAAAEVQPPAPRQA